MGGQVTCLVRELVGIMTFRSFAFSSGAQQSLAQAQALEWDCLGTNSNPAT